MIVLFANYYKIMYNVYQRMKLQSLYLQNLLGQGLYNNAYFVIYENEV